MTLATFGAIDWAVLAVYFIVIVAIGAWAARGQRDEESFYLGGRRMPVWAVALSVLATSQSAATFIGGPESAFAGDLSYLILNLGAIIGALIVALLFIPAFYRAGTLTIYGYLGQRFGPGGMVAASGMFLFGRLLASGARLFIAGLAFSLLLFGDVEMNLLLPAIAVLGVIGTAYTCIGGIKAVIWTDTLQIIIVIGAALISMVLLLQAIPLSFSEMIDVWQNAEGGNKLRLIDEGSDLSQPHTLWTALFAMVFFNMAAYGTDQDLTQRMLTCRSSWRGSLSLIGGILAGLPVVLLFMFIGLLLFIFYQQSPEVADDSRKIYPQYLLNHLPTGVSGLAMAGLFAAAMSSFDSAINAMASTVSADLRVAWRRWRDGPNVSTQGMPALLSARFTVIAMGLVLTLFAIGTALYQEATDQDLIDFALSVMTFAYAGLLGVFLTGLLTRRGNTVSVWSALVVGALSILAMQPSVLGRVTTWWFGAPFQLAFPWRMVVGTTLSFIVCVMGRRKAPPPTEAGLTHASVTEHVPRAARQ